MKTILAFAFLIAGIYASALPKPASTPVLTQSDRFITDTILDGIEEISQQIRDDGYDPFHIEKENYVYELPVPVIFNAAAFVEEVLSTGLSDIVVNYINYSILWSRLDFVIELPHIHLSARVCNGEVTVFGNKLTAAGDGRVDIRDIVVIGEVRVGLGIISGISIRSVTIDLTIGRITSNIRLAIQGENYSEQVNHFVSSTIPATLNEFNEEVNELLGIIVLDIANEYM